MNKSPNKKGYFKLKRKINFLIMLNQSIIQCSLVGITTSSQKSCIAEMVEIERIFLVVAAKFQRPNLSDKIISAKNFGQIIISI